MRGRDESRKEHKHSLSSCVVSSWMVILTLDFITDICYIKYTYQRVYKRKDIMSK